MRRIDGQTDTRLAVDKHKIPPPEETSFGQQFKMLREQKGLSLKSVSDETRIAVSTLRLIEDEAHDKLPDPVFVKGFLRSYATLIGLDANRMIQSYLAGRHHYHQSLQFEAGLLRRARRFRSRLLLSAGIFACVVLASIAVLNNRNGDCTPETAATPSGAIPETVAGTAREPDVGNPVKPKEIPSGYTLQIDVVEKTWLKVITDRQQPKQYSLNPGDQLELNATSGFNLLIGNAAGIHLRLNHQPVAVEGKHGQVVTLKLP